MVVGNLLRFHLLRNLKKKIFNKQGDKIYFCYMFIDKLASSSYWVNKGKKDRNTLWLDSTLFSLHIEAGGPSDKEYRHQHWRDDGHGPQF